MTDFEIKHFKVKRSLDMVKTFRDRSLIHYGFEFTKFNSDVAHYVWANRFKESGAYKLDPFYISSGSNKSKLETIVENVKNPKKPIHLIRPLILKKAFGNYRDDLIAKLFCLKTLSKKN